MNPRTGDPQLVLGGGTFFEAEAPTEPTAGSFDLDRQLRGWLSQAIKESKLDREQVAAEMSRLLGQADDDGVTKAQVDAWTAPSKSAWAFPTKYLSVFVQVTRAHWILDKLASPCGCRVLIGEEALMAQALALQQQHRETEDRLQAVLDKLPPDTAKRLGRRGRA